MKPKSKFTDHCEYFSKPKRQFEKWLSDAEYSTAAECYPAAVHATALIDDFLRDYPSLEKMKILLEKHAEDIGWVSDYEELDGSDDD